MICLIIGYGARALPLLQEILREERIEGIVLTDQNCERELEKVEKAEVIFIYAHELPETVVEKIKETKAKVIACAGLESLTNVPEEVIIKAKTYYVLGGEKNLRNLVRFLASLTGKAIEYEEPEEVPMDGIYHPDLGTFESLDRYLEVYTKRPLVGVLFWRSAWLYKEFKLIRELIKALEEEGFGVIPVFTYGKDPTTGLGREKSEAVEEFFMKDGKPIIEALVSLISFGTVDLKNLQKLNVPVFAPIRSYYQSLEEWEKSKQGVDYMTQVYGVIIPEVAGAIEPIFIAGTRNIEGYKVGEPYEEHMKYLAKRVKKWVELRKKPKSEVKIAIVLINPPCKGLEANVGVGLGLDVPESVVRLLHKLKEEGYYVGENIPKTGEKLIKLILKRKAISEFRWTSVEEIVKSGGAIDFVSLEEYLEWLNELPEDLRERIIKDWGKPEDVLAGKVDKALVGMVYDGKFVVPGIRFGNVFITPQPKFGCAGARCDGKVCRILHDPTIVPPHQWWAVYRWITRKFGADVMIHFGTHGYLEFRPGKGVGLSPSCVPEASLDDVPHLYVYAVSNPMEGVIAKRRGYATLIDHMYPPMGMAEVLDDLDSLLTQYAKAKSLGDEARRRKIYEQILEKAKENKLRIANPEDEEQTIEEIHRYVELMRGSQINLGLHIFGHPPEEPERLAEYVATAMAYDSYYSPSIRRVVAEALGFNYDEIRKNPLGTTNGFTNRELLEIFHRIAVKSLERLLKGESFEVIEEEIEKFGFKVKEKEKLEEAFRKALEVARRIVECEKEYDGFLNGLAGKYVEPGPSGAITRGKFEILPTGRNFYAVDPRTLPTKAAWQIGVETAEKLLKAYKEKHGKYPESVGQVLWSIDGYKADGEQIAQILYLIGVRPVWKGDTVAGLEVIPLEELGRPRIDVLVRISGVVRDTLPNYIYLIDEAIEKVVMLDEPLEMNYIKKHYIEHIKKLVELGKSFEEAQRFARFRVFSAPPGTYGAGVNLAVESSAWKSDEDLAKVWVQWSGYAYGKDAFGVEAHESLVLNLKEVDIVNRNHISDEHDPTNCCCYFAYHGGFKAAVDALTGKNVEVVQTDTRDVSDAKIVDMKVELERVVRAKLLNDRWIEDMKKHGYRGAAEFSKKILHLYGWETTTKLVEDWVFDEIARRYVLDEEMRRWFEEHNPYALEEIARRLIEAYERGLWKTSDELIERLMEVYSEIEGILEESLGEGEVQGGTIEIYTAEDDEHWSEKIEEVDKIWSLVKNA
ncbi:cobaltochelatase subunit CobN [Pyrococcus yayanosii]|uniref:CobN/magnesium chelatase domain protein n=1 Tax=Pyrococcus yayanosii (strain CH1 / JCM 16557) TaxID=529709 RepID=F8AFF4_PYRYC|nr:cobaltochelatase subunit CobN [Pyrococcus yayanosii]AEH23761.1 CobN/magnesium chelatase domain protein [Pyrococcus yayanosii CH1]